MKRLIDANELIPQLKEEYKKVKQAFDETSVFKAPNDVALYGALMQEIGAVIGMIEDAKTIDASEMLNEIHHLKNQCISYERTITKLSAALLMEKSR